MKLYYKLIIIGAFLSSIIILIAGTIIPINYMIIGGVIGILASSILLMGIMIQNNTSVDSTLPTTNTSTDRVITNPIYDV